MFHFIGIDVSKATLQVYIPIKDENISIENSKKSLNGLYSKLKKYYKKEVSNVVFIFEPTGPYSSLLKHFCSQQSIYTFMVNPRQSANFAKALDHRSKTDIIDAKMLYLFHVMAQDGDIKVPVIDKRQETLGEMLSYYKLLQKQRTGFSNHLEALESKDGSNYIIKQLKKEIKQLKLQEEIIITDMKELIKSHEKLNDKFENIKSFKGIGDKAGIALIHLFITYPEANRQELTALSGLDAIEITSGTSINRRSRISKKGSAIYRSMLFMPVLSAVRSNPYMQVFYDRLKENGKHSTVAQIAVMRKMLLIAHSLYKNNIPFDNEVYEKSISFKSVNEVEDVA
ncbi:MAG: IS110 family transposase [Sulfurimonas sp.]|jgi:transposase|nr:IS110 family transposase [Sulfurimonas sp.]